MFKKVIMFLAVIIFICSTALTFKIYFDSYNGQKSKNENTFSKEDDSKYLQDEVSKKVINVENFIEKTKSISKLVIMENEGSFTISHDKTPENDPLKEWLINSELELSLNYKASYAIDTSTLFFTTSDTSKVTVFYQPSNIKVDGIEITSIIATEKSSVFGKKYTPQESASLEIIAKEKIRESLTTCLDQDYATEVLNKALIDLSEEFDIELEIILL